MGGGEASCEILATDLLDEFAETSYNPLWTMKGHKQIFHHWRESKRMQCIPVGAFITYVMQVWPLTRLFPIAFNFPQLHRPMKKVDKDEIVLVTIPAALISQPWSAIVRNVLDHQKTPVLTF